jgi:hypothetical protein
MRPLNAGASCVFVFILAIVLAAAVSSPSWAGEEPGGDHHYIVLELDEHGFAVPVFQTRVSLVEPRQSATVEAVRTSREKGSFRDESLVVRVIDDRGVVFRDIVPVFRDLRGEFHGRPISEGFEIEHVRHRPNLAAAVVRVPVVAGAELVVEGRKSFAFSLDAIEAGRDALALSDWAAETEGDLQRRLALKSAKAGSPSNRVDLLIMGDGYTAAQTATFTADANALIGAFFAVTPYNEYANFVNTSTLFTASTQSGADHPPYLAGCSGDNPACCSDAAAMSDPLAGTYVNTAFDARYCSHMTHRLLVVDNSKVLTAAAAVPNWDVIFVIVNDATYGGSGGAVSVSSTNVLSHDVIRHEYGHTFTGLADEYDSAYPGYPSCSDITGPSCEANVTDVTARMQIKWVPWISPSTVVPTPENAGFGTVVGLFQGARYQPTTMYRPKDVNCLMRALGQPFCEICAQAYVLALYNGGWGVPASGIDLIEPGMETPVPGTHQISGSTMLTVGLLQPMGGPPLNVVWTVNGTVQAGQTNASFIFTPPSVGTYQVAVTVTDQTWLVHQAMAGTSLSSSRQWTLSYPASIFSDGFDGGGTSNWTRVVP